MSERVDAGTQPSLSQPSPTRPPRVRTKVVVLVGIVVALLLAGGVSYFASGSPDGLNRVAEDLGFGDRARDSATAGSPLADYGVRGVDHPVLSGGIAGVAGVLVVLALGSGLAYAVRRRTRTPQPSTTSTDRATGATTVEATSRSTDG
ncbi:PDGLE domain-containing protein [Actinopolymorpha sp. B11F2]|uniref:PDGLE domain-containing protein n=1 Tax=Actinopolymorpha sp. B11F2 TaxID=3160862 RepID=UPI0032E4E8A0